MPLIAYEPKNFRPDSIAMINRANEIANEYAAAGYSLTLRQLYYRFVANGWLANNDKNYKRLGSVINDARMAGMVNWLHLEDRTRNHVDHGGWDSPEQIIDTAAQGYRRNPWEASEQRYRPEVWVEKEALADVVSRACQDRSTPYFACRGYVSQSAMWRAGRRMRNLVVQGFTPVVIHLGDHDPSGIDMTRDIEDRLYTFVGRPVQVNRIALNMDQIEEYDPPPNPAKLTDSRATDYIDRFGYESWELDALPPDTLADLIRDTVNEYVDVETFDEVERQDADQREAMQEIASRWSDLRDNWNEIQDIIG